MRFLVMIILIHATLAGLYAYLFLAEHNFLFLLCSIAWGVCVLIDFATFKIRKYLL